MHGATNPPLPVRRARLLVHGAQSHGISRAGAVKVTCLWRQSGGLPWVPGDGEFAPRKTGTKHTHHSLSTDWNGSHRSFFSSSLSSVLHPPRPNQSGPGGRHPLGMRRTPSHRPEVGDCHWYQRCALVALRADGLVQSVRAVHAVHGASISPRTTVKSISYMP